MIEIKHRVTGATIKAKPSFRALIRSTEWMQRTKQGAHEDDLDRKARSEFEDELHLLPPNVAAGVKRARAAA